MKNDKEQLKQKAIDLVNAYFDGKEIIVKDPIFGIENWTSIKDRRYWTYLAKFCEKVDCYKVIE